VVLTPDGAVAVAATWDRALAVWEVGSGKPLRTLEGRHLRIERVRITPDGRTAVSAGREATLRVWDLVSGKCLRTMAGHGSDLNDVALTLDGRTAASASDDQTVRVWDLGSGECLATYDAGAAVTTLSTVRPDGRLVCGTADGQVQVLTLRCLPQGSPIVTPVVLWRFQSAEPALAGKENGAGGRYDRDPTVECPWCGVRAALPAEPLDVIERLKCELPAGWAHCLELPAEAWSDPGLETTCPGCGGAWRLNPFIVDRRRTPPV
jgi:hypothetical protein